MSAIATISDEQLTEAASHLAAMLASLGARVGTVTIERWKNGLGASAIVNDKTVTCRMPKGVVPWAQIATQLIADADALGGVSKVM